MSKNQDWKFSESQVTLWFLRKDETINFSSDRTPPSTRSSSCLFLLSQIWIFFHLALMASIPSFIIMLLCVCVSKSECEGLYTLIKDACHAFIVTAFCCCLFEVRLFLDYFKQLKTRHVEFCMKKSNWTFHLRCVISSCGSSAARWHRGKCSIGRYVHSENHEPPSCFPRKS